MVTGNNVVGGKLAVQLTGGSQVAAAMWRWWPEVGVAGGGARGG